MGKSESLIGKTIFGYHVDEQIGSGGFGTVYRISKTNESGKYVYALKHITFPSEAQYNDVLSSMGGDRLKANNYFITVLNDILYEINILNSLSEKNNSYVVAYYDNDIVKQENPLRYDVYIRMEFLTPLPDYFRRNEIRVEDVINIGLDILSALNLAHSNNIIHRDIKDDNIFMNKDGKFKLGDFGIAKVLKDSSKAASMKGTPAFIAPEVYLGKEKYNNTVDLYSLGIVLYKMLNYSRLPFLPGYPEDYKLNDVEMAIERRLIGEIPGPPAKAPLALGEVILKSIASKDNRYAGAKDFFDALNDVKAKLSEEEKGQVINRHILDNKPQCSDTVVLTHNSGNKDKSVETTIDIASYSKKEEDNIQYDLQHAGNENIIMPTDKSVYGGDEQYTHSDIGTNSVDAWPQVVENTEKKSFTWLIYSAPAVIGITGIILFFALIPKAIGKMIPLDVLISGDIDSIIKTFGENKPSGTSIIIFRIVFGLFIVAFMTLLFFAGKQLQKKKKPTASGARLRGKDGYYKVLEISQAVNEAKLRIKKSEISKLQSKIKIIEEKLRIESDFGCGNDRVTECENNIAEQLELLQQKIKNLSEDAFLDEKLNSIEKIVSGVSDMLRFRTEITKR